MQYENIQMSWLHPGVRSLLGSNVTLTPQAYSFVKHSLVSTGINGSFEVDWAGTAGSGRKFYRISLGKKFSAILMLWEHCPEWEKLMVLSSQASLEGILPAVISTDAEHGFLLVQDGGARQLRDLLYTGLPYLERLELLKTVLLKLRRWSGAYLSADFRGSLLHMDEEHLGWEGDYFRKHISELIPTVANLFDEKWQKEKDFLVTTVKEYDKGLLHRDFQSENILVKNGVITFVDTQGCRLGPLEYDVSSLLFDPYTYTAIPYGMREELLVFVEDSMGIPAERIYLAGAQRLMQALGAYGNLSLNKGKIKYQKFVYPALQLLAYVTYCDPRLQKINSIALLALKEWQNGKNEIKDKKGLQVKNV